MSIMPISFARRSATLIGLRRETGQEGVVAFDLLATPNIRWVVLGYAMTMGGAQVRNVGLGWLALEMTDSQFWVGMAVSVPALVIILLSLVGGALADWLDRRRLILLSRMSQSALAFALGFAITSHTAQMWHVLLFGVLIGATFAFHNPAQQVLVQDVAGRAHLTAALALNNTLGMAATMVGPAVGGVIIAAAGTDWVFYLLAAMYTGGMVAIFLVRPPESAKQLPIPMLRSIFEGLQYIARTPRVAWLTFLAALVFFIGMWMPLVPVFARDVLGAGSSGFGYLMGAWGAGNLVSSAYLSLTGGVRSRRGLTIVLASVVIGLTLVVFAISRNFALSMAAQFVFGIFAAIWIINVPSVLQLTSDEEMRGRVMGVYFVALQLLGVGGIAGGALAQAFGNTTALVIAGVAFSTLNGLAYCASRALREID